MRFSPLSYALIGIGIVTFLFCSWVISFLPGAITGVVVALVGTALQYAQAWSNRHELLERLKIGRDQPRSVKWPLSGKQARAARAAALEQGLEVREVTRSPEHTRDRGGRNRDGEFDCVEYSLRHEIRSGLRWRCLLRREHSDVGRGTKLEAGSRELPQALVDALRVVYQDPAFDGELFEFEGDDRRVAVYWAEWGGEQLATRLAGYLRELSDAMS